MGVFMKFILACLIFALPLVSIAQNLHSERIWKVADHKKSIYLDQGIFHWQNSADQNFRLKNVRNSYVASLGYERIVFDFEEEQLPSIYGMIATPQKKIYIDFFNTSLSAQLNKLKNAKFVSKVDVFTLDKKALSIELSLKEKASFDVFILTNPARLVIDIKK
jgi:hypothetical protein